MSEQNQSHELPEPGAPQQVSVYRGSEVVAQAQVIASNSQWQNDPDETDGAAMFDQTGVKPGDRWTMTITCEAVGGIKNANGKLRVPYVVVGQDGGVKRSAFGRQESEEQPYVPPAQEGL